MWGREEDAKEFEVAVTLQGADIEVHMLRRIAKGRFIGWGILYHVGGRMKEQ